MTCAKCGSRNQFVQELGGGVICISCAYSPGMAIIKPEPKAKTCTVGHEMVLGDPICWTCKYDAQDGTASRKKSSEAQRLGMKLVVLQRGVHHDKTG